MPNTLLLRLGCFWLNYQSMSADAVSLHGGLWMRVLVGKWEVLVNTWDYSGAEKSNQSTAR